MEKSLKWLLPLALVAIFPFFFVSGPDLFSSLLFNQLWNFGHVIFFGGLTLWLQQLKPVRFWRGWLLLLIIVLIVSIAIEFAQKSVGRNASWDDVWHNLCGVFLALAWGRGAPANRVLRIGFRLASVALLLPFLWLVTYLVYSDFRMRNQFPVINDFETGYEMMHVVRIGEGLTREQSADYFTHGASSLAVYLGTAKYSGLKWAGNYGDWRRYKTFAMDIYNPDSTELSVALKIADMQHDNGSNAWDDRFNRSLTLVPGWNYVRVAIDDIRTAPAGRSMRMNEITCLEIFSRNLDKSRLIYVDHLRLE